MILRDISFSTPQENILFDDVLFQLTEKGTSEEVLRIWESPQFFIVLGLTGKIADDVIIKETQARKIPILKRSSGGGAVLQGPGCLNYSLVLSKSNPSIRDLRKSYQYILGKIIQALVHCGHQTVFQPISDLATKDQEKKFSGNAQRRGKHYILHHGTILYDFDLLLIDQFLKHPKDTPKYRRERNHLNFVTNLDLSKNQFIKSLKKEFDISAEHDKLSKEESNCLKRFVKEKNIMCER